MDIQVGDKITYKNLEGKIVTVEINSDSYLSHMKEMLKVREIIKIERPKYEVVEEKKELLTEEEKELIKPILENIPQIAFVRKCLSSIQFHEALNIGWIISLDQTLSSTQFSNLEEDKYYSIKELGIN